MNKLPHISYYNLKFISFESFCYFVYTYFEFADLCHLVLLLDSQIIHAFVYLLWCYKGWSLESYLVCFKNPLFISFIFLLSTAKCCKVNDSFLCRIDFLS